LSKKKKNLFLLQCSGVFALVVALLTKLSYFVVLWALLWVYALSERSRSALASCIVGAGAVVGLYLLWPNYFETVWNIALVRRARTGFEVGVACGARRGCWSSVVGLFLPDEKKSSGLCFLHHCHSYPASL
jgi:hypothetical protein